MDPIDTDVCSAIRQIVKEKGESDKVAEQLLHWLAQISKGEMDLDNTIETERKFDQLREHLSQSKEEQ